MIVYRVPSSLLTDYAQVGQHQQVLAKYKRQDAELQNYNELVKLISMQEGLRLLRNYNYMKDTEFLTQYAYAESIKEQRLVQRAASVGLYIDRYI
jgi:hypothetical protein